MAVVNLSENKLLKLSKNLDKDLTITDASGLIVYLRKKANGCSIFFYARKVINGKRTRIKIGQFPFITLAEARAEYIKLISNISRGVSLEQALEKKVTFFELWTKFIEIHCSDFEETTNEKYLSIYRTHFERYADYDIKRFDKNFVKSEILQPLIDSKHLSQCHTVAGILYRVFDCAEDLDLIPLNPLAKISKAIPKYKNKHHPTFGLEETEELTIKLFNDFAAHCSLKMQALLHFYFYTLLRNVEVRKLKIADIKDNYFYLKNKTWKDIEYKACLPTQALDLIKWLIAHHKNPDNPYLFEGEDSFMVSENTINNNLKKLGYKGKLTCHGIRSIGFKWLNDQPDIKEMTAKLCIAHKSGLGDPSDQAYNGTDYFNLRTRDLQKWADFVEKCIGKNRFY